MKKQVRNKLRGSAGFTLVELVVVIAIIGILAGVGTVGYGGYVKKANEAADQQLLGEVNTAFAAACVENGTEIYAVNDAKLAKDTAELSDVTIDGAVNGKIPTSYKAYLGETNGFKVIEPKYSNYKHIFVDGRNNVQYAYGGGAVTISGKDAANLKDSTFADSKKGLGVNGLLDKVNDIAKIAEALAGSSEGGQNALEQIWNSEGFLKYAAKAVGLKGKELDDAAKDGWSMTNEALMTALGDKAKALGMDVNDEDVFNKLMGNATILYAAKDTKNINQEEMTKLLTSEKGFDQIKKNLDNSETMGTALSQASLVYGMYTAYIYSGAGGSNDKEGDTSNPMKALTALNTDENFKNYIKSEQGAKDMKAYLSAMNMINSSVDDEQAVTKLLQNGFADPDLKALLNNSLQ